MLFRSNYYRQIGSLPLFLESRLRIRDEEDTESQNSFMQGEDTAEFSAGLYYREFKDLELYLTGRLEQFVPESRSVEAPHSEAQFLTGVKYIFDTHYQWSSVGSFHGTVFKDVNGNGVFDAGDSGIESITVMAGDKKTVTDAGGLYSIRSVPGKKVKLAVDASKIPQGYAPTSSPRRDVENLNGGDQQVDFGFSARSEVGGIVYNDLNGSGRYDAGDVGVKVALAAIPSDKGMREDSILFSESNSRFIVEVEQESAAAFEDAVKDLPFAWIGETATGSRLVVNGPAGALVDEHLSDLKEAWKRPLGSV